MDAAREKELIAYFETALQNVNFSAGTDSTTPSEVAPGDSPDHESLEADTDTASTKSGSVVPRKKHGDRLHVKSLVEKFLVIRC